MQVTTPTMMMMSKPYSGQHLEGRGSATGLLIAQTIFIGGTILAKLTVRALGIGDMKQTRKSIIPLNQI